jgi:hypothetical protein
MFGMLPMRSLAGLRLGMLVFAPASTLFTWATDSTDPMRAFTIPCSSTAAPATMGVAADVLLKLSTYFAAPAEVVVTFTPCAKQSMREPKFEAGTLS